MENATKALIIAGGILISMLVISIGVYLFASYGNISSSHDKNMEAIEIQKFNSNFTKFEGRNNITIHEIVSVVNFAKQYKEQNGIDIEIYILNNELKDDNSITLIENYSTKYFKCNFSTSVDVEHIDIEYDENGKVKKITFRNA